MGNFQGGSNRGRSFRGGNRERDNGDFRSGNRGGRGRGEVIMHKAICDKCHKSCEVPFRPSNDKPIYCNDCFSSKRSVNDRGSRKDFGNRGGTGQEFNNRSAFSNAVQSDDYIKKELSEINNKLDKLIGMMNKDVISKKSIKIEKKEKPIRSTSSIVNTGGKKTLVKKVQAKKKVVKKEKTKVKTLGKKLVKRVIKKKK